MRKRGFTLIELLIVVAIIAILAAIAVPNFLEAQSRAKVARAKSDIRSVVMAINMYIMDNNKIFPDVNDKYNGNPKLAGLTYSKENPGVPADMKFTVSEQYYVRRVFTPLSTPIAYLSAIMNDPFSKVVPFGFDTREYPASGQPIAYCVLFSGGPDRVDGDWYRGNNPGINQGCPYDPSNGTISRGDVWRAIAVKDSEVMKREYPFEYN